jgi:quaternary ammonium compound-resistance protein SugE
MGVLNMAWIYLFIAGVFEVAWALGLKHTDGFTKFYPTMGVLILMFFSVLFLTLAVQKIPLSTGYVIWTGIGAAGTVIFGIVYFGETATLIRIVLLSTILLCIVGLKFTSIH